MFSSLHTRSPFVVLAAVLLIVLTATHGKEDGRILEKFITAGKQEKMATIIFICNLKKDRKQWCRVL